MALKVKFNLKWDPGENRLEHMSNTLNHPVVVSNEERICMGSEAKSPRMPFALALGSSAVYDEDTRNFCNAYGWVIYTLSAIDLTLLNSD